MVKTNRPMMETDDDIAMFAERDDACHAADGHPLGSAFGYEVYEW